MPARSDAVAPAFDELLARLSATAGDPDPGAASTAAVTTAMAASLVTMAASRSLASWPEAGGAGAQSSTLATRALELAPLNAEAYAAAASALERGTGIEEPLRATVDALLALADVAADVAALAALVATRCVRLVQPDAEAAAVLAESAVRVAEALIRANLTVGPDDPRLVRIARVRDDAVSAVRRAVEAAL